MSEAFPDNFLNDLIKTLSDFLRSKPFVLLAIDGGIASGKSTLARKLWEKTDGFWSGPDDFVDPDVFSSDRPVHEKPFRWDSFKNDFLLPLHRGQRAVYQPYDWDKGLIGAPVSAEAQGILIIEGMFTLDPEIRDLFDYKIWVQGCPDSRLQRLQTRETPESYDLFLRRWIPLEEHYKNSHPWQNADFIVAGIDQDLSGLRKILA